jgi:hypothetical protein
MTLNCSLAFSTGAVSMADLLSVLELDTESLPAELAPAIEGGAVGIGGISVGGVGCGEDGGDSCDMKCSWLK